MTSPSPTLTRSPVAELFGPVDATGLGLRLVQPGKVVSVYRTSTDIAAALTALARAGRRAHPQLGWTLEFSPVETVLVLAGPDDALAALGLDV